MSASLIRQRIVNFMLAAGFPTSISRLVATRAPATTLTPTNSSPRQARPARKPETPATAPLHPNPPTPQQVQMQLWEAMNIIAATAPDCTTAGNPEIDAAWARVGDRLGSYLQALIHLRRDLPTFVERRNYPRRNPAIESVTEQLVAWTFDVCSALTREIDVVTTAIWKEAPLAAYDDVNDVLARHLEHMMRGLPATVTYLDGPVAKRECHVRDNTRSDAYPEGRVLITRLLELGPGGKLEILDNGGGTLSRQQSIKPSHNLVFARAATKHLCFTFVENRFMYSDSLCVIPGLNFSLFAVLSSDLHTIWAWERGSRMKQDLRYSHRSNKACAAVRKAAYTDFRAYTVIERDGQNLSGLTSVPLSFIRMAPV